ncbi:unnamed protein product [Caenorhabditis sp. 36 PRJEB53466]|nr:unnamed protein product [Caenorhabditis sp. 36 PRJEB53466]
MNSDILNYPLSRNLSVKLIGQFIGHEGINIYKIERENGVALDIWRDETDESFVRITGPYWNLKMALNDVCLLVSEIRNNNREYNFVIPTKDVGFLIGKNGAKINEIKLSSGVDVHFDKGGDGEDSKVIVTGNYQTILTGLRLVFDRFNSKGQKSLYENPRTRQFAEAVMESF